MYQRDAIMAAEKVDACFNKMSMRGNNIEMIKNMKFKQIMFLAVSFSLTVTANAGRYWPETVLTNWNLYLNNGVAYIISNQMADHCSYNRAQINMDGTEFNKSLYAYAMSAKARGKNLEYVIDSTQTNCVISGLRELD